MHRGRHPQGFPRYAAADIEEGDERRQRAPQRGRPAAPQREEPMTEEEEAGLLEPTGKVGVTPARTAASRRAPW